MIRLKTLNQIEGAFRVVVGGFRLEDALHNPAVPPS
jgi:hypothetical protein